jgi:hypothetical protein
MLGIDWLTAAKLVVDRLEGMLETHSDIESQLRAHKRRRGSEAAIVSLCNEKQTARFSVFLQLSNPRLVILSFTVADR